MTKTTTQYLEENGYKQYKPVKGGSDALYQKRVTDEKGTKYFININHYHFNGVNIPKEIKKKYEYDYNVVFTSKENDNPIEITLYAGWQPDEAERHFEELFNTGLYKYYEG